MQNTDSIRALIRALLQQKGITMKALSQRLGKNEAYIHQYFKFEKPKILPKELRAKTAEILGVPEPCLNESGLASARLGELLSPILKPAPPNLRDSGPSAAPLSPAGDVPIMGYAAGSDDALLFNNGSIVGRAPRHPNQSSARDAFAVYTAGDSMSPRYEPGEIVYAVAGRPPQPNADCIVELQDGTAFLKRFVRKTDKDVVCQQLNPPQEWRRPLAEIKAIHAVVGRG